MWVRSFSKTFQGIKKEYVWKLWEDVNTWTKWHSDLDYCKMEGKFEVGNYFILKPKGVNEVKITITDIQLGKSFTDCTKFFGAKMYDTHALEETDEGLKLTNTIVVVGPLKWIWVKLVAQNVFNSIPSENEALVDLIRSYDKK
jgi:hypothetical protein